MKTGRELIDAIQQVAKIEWGKCSSYKEIPNNAFYVWRFDPSVSKEQEQKVIDTLRTALKQVATIAWALEFSGRNWVLHTEKASQLVKSGKFRTSLEINDYIFQEEPELFIKAQEDSFNIAEAFSKLVLEE